MLQGGQTEGSEARTWWPPPRVDHRTFPAFFRTRPADDRVGSARRRSGLWPPTPFAVVAAETTSKHRRRLSVEAGCGEVLRYQLQSWFLVFTSKPHRLKLGAAARPPSNSSERHSSGRLGGCRRSRRRTCGVQCTRRGRCRGRRARPGISARLSLTQVRSARRGLRRSPLRLAISAVLHESV